MEEIEYMKTGKIRRERERSEALRGVEGIGYLHRKRDIRDKLSAGLATGQKLAEQTHNLAAGVNKWAIEANRRVSKSPFGQSKEESFLQRMARRNRR
jgi:hypothetical protein